MLCSFSTLAIACNPSQCRALRHAGGYAGYDSLRAFLELIHFEILRSPEHAR